MVSFVLYSYAARPVALTKRVLNTADRMVEFDPRALFTRTDDNSWLYLMHTEYGNGFGKPQLAKLDSISDTPPRIFT